MTAIRPRSAAAIPAMSEAELQTEVIRLARSLGWGTTLSARKALLEQAKQYGVEAPPLDGLCYHPRYSLGSEPGWPDLVLVRRRDRRLVFAELKSERGDIKPRQAEVMDLLRCLEGLPAWDGSGLWVKVVVWRPSHLSSGAIDEVLR